jgi:hypothetical protein
VDILGNFPSLMALFTALVALYQAGLFLRLFEDDFLTVIFPD